MAGRRTNLALLAALAAAVLTGAAAYAIGTGWVRAATVAHGVSGVGVVVLVPWKAAVIRRGLRRRPARETAPSVVLAGLVLVTVTAGVRHSVGLADLGPVSAMQLHVGVALMVMPLAAWHLRVRPVPLRRTDLQRRNLLHAGVLLGGAAAAWAAVEGLVAVASLPGAARRSTGSHERGSGEPSAMPVTQWLDDPVVKLDAAGWRLTVVAGERIERWTREELDAATVPVEATLDCTGGWYARQRWDGVPLSRLVGDRGAARSVVARSVTGYRRRYPIRDLDHLYVATRLGGERLSAGHGFPARIIAPGRRGFWWVKWLDVIELSARPWWLQPPFPLI